MDEPTTTKDKLEEYVRKISEEIGPRPAGSSAEEETFDFISAELKGFGYAIKESPVLFPTPPRFDPIYPLGGITLALATMLLDQIIWIGLILPIFGMALPQIYQAWIYNRKPDQETKNILASLQSFENDTIKSKTRLIISAHVDSGLASPFTNRILLWLQGHTLDMFQRTAFFAAFVSIFMIIGLPIPDLLFNLVRIAGLLTCGWILFSTLSNYLHLPKYSSGANDNASGLAVCMVLAEQAALFPPSRLEVQFLFTGAEETGLHGARAFANNLADAESECAVVVLDSIGTGERISVATRDGTLIRRKTSTQLNDLLWAVCPDSGTYWFTHKSADHLPFLQKGIAATTLVTYDHKQGISLDHTQFDDLKAINFIALEKHTNMLLKFIEYSNSSLISINSNN